MGDDDGTMGHEKQFSGVREGEFIHPTRGKLVTFLRQVRYIDILPAIEWSYTYGYGLLISSASFHLMVTCVYVTN